MTWAEPVKDWSDRDRRHGLPTDLQIERLAQAIDAAHARFRHAEGAVGAKTSQHRAVGLYGERHIARVLGLEMDLSVRPYGSRRRNLRLSDGTTLDVVTRTPLRNGGYPDLVRKVNARGKVDALILVVWHGRHYEPEVPGFIYEPDLVALNRIKEFVAGAPNYTAPVALLSPLRFLVARHDPGSPYALEGSDWLLSDAHAARAEEDGPAPATPTPSQPALFDVSPIPTGGNPRRDPWRS